MYPELLERLRHYEWLRRTYTELLDAITELSMVLYKRYETAEVQYTMHETSRGFRSKASELSSIFGT
jgi:hypothetical protein